MVNDNPDNPEMCEADVVISRLLDGRGKAADWRRLRDATRADAATWDQVINGAGDQDALCEAVTALTDSSISPLLSAPGCVDTHPVSLALAGDGAALSLSNVTGRRHDRAVRSARLGWLVAACMALGLVSVYLRPAGMPTGTGGVAAGVNIEQLTSAELMKGYKERAVKEGTLVAEVPQRVVLETRPAPDGKGYEVLFMRQFIERAIVDDLYKLGSDDAGRPVMVPASMNAPRPAGAM